jgi:HSP90 family molecular chaperone
MKLAKTDPNREHTASTAAKPPNIAPVKIKYANTYIVLSIKTKGDNSCVCYWKIKKILLKYCIYVHCPLLLLA